MSTDFRELMSKRLDGTLTASEHQALEEWLLSGDKQLDVFVEWMRMHVAITHVLAERDYLALRDESSQSSEKCEAPAVPRSLEDAVLHLHSGRSRKAAFAKLLGIAATLIVGMALLWDDAADDEPARQANARQEPAPAAAAETAIAATVSNAQDVIWAEGTLQFDYGEDVPQGQIVILKSGHLELTFNSGATVLLAGPCRFRVDKELNGTLFMGKLAASVPPRARGFVIDTPTSEVVDLGTEFGVAVDSSGQSEVHVFEGEVLSRSRREKDRKLGSTLHLSTNQAARFDGVEETPTLSQSDASNFTRPLYPHLDESELPSLPVSRSLALWLAADGLLHLDEDQAVVGWNDLLYGDNERPENAVQPVSYSRPRLVRNAYGKRSTVRFDGIDSYLTTLPLATTDNQTMIAVIAFATEKTTYGQIINYNGPPHRLLKANTMPGVFMINCNWSKELDHNIVNGLVHSGSDGKEWHVEGHVRSQAKLPHGKLMVVAYVYDLEAKQSTLFVNGHLQMRSAAHWPAGITSRKVIGRSGFGSGFFHGDISEMLIYNSALSQEELDDVTDALVERYQIDTQVGEPPHVVDRLSSQGDDAAN